MNVFYKVNTCNVGVTGCSISNVGVGCINVDCRGKVVSCIGKVDDCNVVASLIFVAVLAYELVEVIPVVAAGFN